MGAFGYLIYAITVFTIYMLWLLGSSPVFMTVIVPWLVFMAVLWAPLIWLVYRK